MDSTRPHEPERGLFIEFRPSDKIVFCKSFHEGGLWILSRHHCQGVPRGPMNLGELFIGYSEFVDNYLFAEMFAGGSFALNNEPSKAFTCLHQRWRHRRAPDVTSLRYRVVFSSFL